MLEQVNEKVSVVVVYDRMQGTVYPKRLRWHGRAYVITQVGYYHAIKQGRTLIHVFHVTDGTLDFRLSCNAETLFWTLEEVSDGCAS